MVHRSRSQAECSIRFPGHALPFSILSCSLPATLDAITNLHGKLDMASYSLDWKEKEAKNPYSVLSWPALSTLLPLSAKSVSYHISDKFSRTGGPLVCCTVLWCTGVTLIIDGSWTADPLLIPFFPPTPSLLPLSPSSSLLFTISRISTVPTSQPPTTVLY